MIRNMARPPAKEAGMDFRCLLESNYWRTLKKPPVAQIKKSFWVTQGKTVKKTSANTFVFLGLLFTWLKAHPEPSHCCSGGCHPLWMLLSHMRKGNYKPCPSIQRWRPYPKWYQTFLFTMAAALVCLYQTFLEGNKIHGETFKCRRVSQLQ